MPRLCSRTKYLCSDPPDGREVILLDPMNPESRLAIEPYPGYTAQSKEWRISVYISQMTRPALLLDPDVSMSSHLQSQRVGVLVDVQNDEFGVIFAGFGCIAVLKFGVVVLADSSMTMRAKAVAEDQGWCIG